jgi:hypothetical protein
MSLRPSRSELESLPGAANRSTSARDLGTLWWATTAMTATPSSTTPTRSSSESPWHSHVLGAHGISSEEYSIAHLASWAESSHLEVLEHTAAQIDRLARRIEDAALSEQATASWERREVDVTERASILA